MIPEGSLPCSQQPATNPCPQPNNPTFSTYFRKVPFIYSLVFQVVDIFTKNL